MGRRIRGPLYDKINVQGSSRNQFSSTHYFYVNVGVGSTEMDAVHVELPPAAGGAVREYLLDLRWQDFDPDLPPDVTFDHRVDADRLADEIVAGLDAVLAGLDNITTSIELAEWSIAHNGLRHVEKTAAFLASVGAVEMLGAYARSLRSRFGDEARWPFFNGTFVTASGDHAAALIDEGILDPGPI